MIKELFKISNETDVEYATYTYYVKKPNKTEIQAEINSNWPLIWFGVILILFSIIKA